MQGNKCGQRKNSPIKSRPTKKSPNNITLEIDFNFFSFPETETPLNVVQRISSAPVRHLIDSHFQFDL